MVFLSDGDQSRQTIGFLTDKRSSSSIKRFAERTVKKTVHPRQQRFTQLTRTGTPTRGEAHAYNTLKFPLLYWRPVLCC
jgi:hypothetical protein